MRIIQLLTSIALLVCSRPARATWSIVAIDRTSGDVGVAMASCVPMTHGDAVAALVPGKGAAATQAFFSIWNRDVVFASLKEGRSAEEVIQAVTDPGNDENTAIRQYGVVTLSQGLVRAAIFTGGDCPPWAGGQSDTNFGVAVQGNILVSEAVVVNAMAAFKQTDSQGRNTLPDRLLRALEAGSAAGGDSRCNNDETNQTAATAFILMARGMDPPYAAEAIGLTDMDTANAPWLAISVTSEQFGANPIFELRARYDAWRQTAFLSPPSLRAERAGGDIVVSWSGSGTLQAADSVLGAWIDLTAAVSPYTNSPAAGQQKFYRLKQ